MARATRLRRPVAIALVRTLPRPAAWPFVGALGLALASWLALSGSLAFGS